MKYPETLKLHRKLEHFDLPRNEEIYLRDYHYVGAFTYKKDQRHVFAFMHESGKDLITGHCRNPNCTKPYCSAQLFQAKCEDLNRDFKEIQILMKETLDNYKALLEL